MVSPTHLIEKTELSVWLIAAAAAAAASTPSQNSASTPLHLEILLRLGSLVYCGSFNAWTWLGLSQDNCGIIQASQGEDFQQCSSLKCYFSFNCVHVRERERERQRQIQRQRERMHT